MAALSIGLLAPTIADAPDAIVEYFAPGAGPDEPTKLVDPETNRVAAEDGSIVTEGALAP